MRRYFLFWTKEYNLNLTEPRQASATGVPLAVLRWWDPCPIISLGSPTAFQHWVATASIRQASFRGQRSRVTKPGEWRSEEAELFSVSSTQPLSFRHTSFWQSGPVHTHTHTSHDQWDPRLTSDRWALSKVGGGWVYLWSLQYTRTAGSPHTSLHFGTVWYPHHRNSLRGADVTKRGSIY